VPRRKDRVKEQRQHLLASEVGRRWSGQGRIRVALVFPNTYHVGMSNLGFQIIWQKFDGRDDVSCERVFASGDATEPRSLESGTPLRMFDVVAFSISFELDLPRIISLLNHAGIPLLGVDRDDGEPFIIAGGVVCAMNPEPLAPYADAIFIGEAEYVIDELFDLLARYTGGRRHRGVDTWRTGLLRALVSIPGIYVPRFYEPTYAPGGRLVELLVRGDAPARIERQVAGNLDAEKTASVVVTCETEFPDTYLIEIGRGCPHGCRFCLAGFVYRPFRKRSVQRLLEWIEGETLPCHRVGLIGAALSDFPDLDRLIVSLSESVKEVGISSLRADAIIPSLITALTARGQRTLAIAPEAGSQRLRDVINKRLDEETIVRAAETAGNCGITRLRLYFMVGLPWEEDEDVLAVAPLVRAMRRTFFASNGKRITVSINPFVPKPQTPFQWHPMAPRDVLKRRLQLLERDLSSLGGVRILTKSVRLALLQGLVARGGRPVGEAIAIREVTALSWKRACARAGVDMEGELHRERRFDGLLPWDHIDVGVGRHFLWEEYRRAAQIAGRLVDGGPAPPG